MDQLATTGLLEVGQSTSKLADHNSSKPHIYQPYFYLYQQDQEQICCLGLVQTLPSRRESVSLQGLVAEDQVMT